MDFVCVPDATSSPSQSPPSCRNSSCNDITWPGCTLTMRDSTMSLSPATMHLCIVTFISMERPATKPAAICPILVIKSTISATAPSWSNELAFSSPASLASTTSVAVADPAPIGDPVESNAPAATIVPRTVPSASMLSNVKPASSASKVQARRRKSGIVWASRRPRMRAPQRGGGASASHCGNTARATASNVAAVHNTPVHTEACGGAPKTAAGTAASMYTTPNANAGRRQNAVLGVVRGIVGKAGVAQ